MEHKNYILRDFIGNFDFDNYTSIESIFVKMLELNDSYASSIYNEKNLNKAGAIEDLKRYIVVPSDILEKKTGITEAVRQMKKEISLNATEKEVINWIFSNANAVSWYYYKKHSSNLFIEDIDILNVNSDNKSLENLINKYYLRDRSFACEHLIHLNRLGVNYTLKAAVGKLDPAIGREKEIEQIVTILLKKQQNNPVLIGEPGVGKTQIVEGLAWYLYHNKDDVNERLRNAKIYAVDIADLVANTKYVGEFEAKILTVLKELKEDSSVILFIDEFHKIIGAGASSDKPNNDFANLLKPAMARGEVRIIGATTKKEYQRFIANDGALERRIDIVEVRENSQEETVNILMQGKEFYETFHKITIPTEIVQPIVKLTVDFLPMEKLPGGAFKLLDYACARCVLNNGKELSLKHVEHSVSKLSRVDIGTIQQDKADKFGSIRKSLAETVYGQDKAIDEMVKMLGTAIHNWSSRQRPLGVFFFAGSTGVGKTHFARTLAEVLFGSAEKLLKIDLSTFTQSIDKTRLIGSPPGYVGYQEKGELTNFVKINPGSVVLLDEVEKAHKEIINMFLNVFDDGVIKDSSGQEYNCKNVIFLLTSNVARKKIISDILNGGSSNSKSENEKRRSMDKVLIDGGFSREFINRIDSIVFFNNLDLSALRSVLETKLNEYKKKINEDGYDFEVGEEIKERVIQVSVEEDMGARPINRYISEMIINPLALFILENRITSGTALKMKYDDACCLVIESVNKGGNK